MSDTESFLAHVSNLQAVCSMETSKAKYTNIEDAWNIGQVELIKENGDNHLIGCPNLDVSPAS